MGRPNLEVLELGNADLYGEGQWTGTPDTADGHAAPLPEYPSKDDLPPDPVPDALRELAAERGRDLLLFGAGCGFGGFLLGVVF